MSTVPGAEQVLTPEALEFVRLLHDRFGGRRHELLRAAQHPPWRRPWSSHRRPRGSVRSDWTVAAAPADLVDRRVEITGPPERKMTINALNSGARVWLADLEDASTPHWANVVGGQANLRDAIRREVDFTSPDGKRYALHKGPLATIVMRPRGWHLDERNVQVDGEPVAGALVDFGLYFFHNAAELLARGSGPYFYLPKMESHLEARLWNDTFVLAQDELGDPPGLRPRHGPHRDPSRGLRDGGDPLRAA